MRMGLYELGDLASFYDGRMGDRRWETKVTLLIDAWDKDERVATRRVGLSVCGGSVSRSGLVDDDGDIDDEMDAIMDAVEDKAIAEMKSEDFLVQPCTGGDDWCSASLDSKAESEGVKCSAWLAVRAVEVEEEMDGAQ